MVSGWYKSATHYLFGENEGFSWIELRWCDAEGAIKLPYEINSYAKLFGFVRAWLDDANYGEEPDTDGSTNKGWSVKVGSVSGKHINFYAVCRIEAEWIVYGK